MYTKSMIRQDIKSRARVALSGNWGTAILVLLINVLIGLGFSTLQVAFSSMLSFQQTYLVGALEYSLNELIASPIVSLLMIFITVPLQLGVVSWYVTAAKGKKEGLGHIFSWFESGKKYWKSLGISISLGLRTLLYSILLYAAVFVLAFGVALLGEATMVGTNIYFGQADSLWFVLLCVLAVVAIVALLILYTVFVARYTLVQFLAVQNPEKKINQLFRESVHMMKGHKWEYFVFTLSFIGWSLLMFFTCGLIVFFLVPYQQMATAMFAFYIVDTHQKELGEPPLFGSEEEEAPHPVSFSEPLPQHGNGWAQSAPVPPPMQPPMSNGGWQQPGVDQSAPKPEDSLQSQSPQPPQEGTDEPKGD